MILHRIDCRKMKEDESEEATFIGSDGESSVSTIATELILPANFVAASIETKSNPCRQDEKANRRKPRPANTKLASLLARFTDLCALSPLLLSGWLIFHATIPAFAFLWLLLHACFIGMTGLYFEVKYKC